MARLALLISILALLCGCSAPAFALLPTSKSTPTATVLSPTATPSTTATATLIPTETPIPFPADVQTWIASHPDFHWQTEITTTGLTLSSAELERRLKIGQGDVLQIYTENEKYIEYAWNVEQHTWINTADIIQKDRNDFSNYIRVQTRAQLDAMFNLEQLVLTPFPADTYFPPLDKLSIDYWTYDIARDYYSPLEFDYFYPFGNATDPSRLPFRFANFILLLQGEGRKTDTYIVTEQIYNPADGTFSLMHFGFDKWGETSGGLDQGLSDLLSFTEPPNIFIPQIFLMIYRFCNMTPVKQIGAIRWIGW